MKIDLDIFEYMKLVESAWHDGTILTSTMLQKAIGEWFDIVPEEWIPGLHEYWSRTQEARTENQQRVIARYNPENRYRVTLSDHGKSETRIMYRFDGRYWNGISTFAPKELITKIEKV